MASERAKREAWMAEQTRSIKERTIKGLEPELQVQCLFCAVGVACVLLEHGLAMPADWKTNIMGVPACNCRGW